MPVSALSYEAWEKEVARWLSSPDQAMLERLREQILPEKRHLALKQLHTFKQTPQGRDHHPSTLLWFYLAFDSGDTASAAEALKQLRSSALPASYLTLLEVSLALQMGDLARAWEHLSPLTAETPPQDDRLAALWYTHSDNRIDDILRYRIYGKWITERETLAQSPSAWLRLGGLALMSVEARAAVSHYRQGINVFLKNPEYLPPFSSASITDTEAVTQSLYRLLAQAHQEGIPLLPIGGTLLALEREGKLFKGDKDADLAVPSASFQAALTWMENKGWKILERKPKLARYHMICHPEFPIAVDLFAHYEEGDNTIVSGWWLEGGDSSEGRFTRLPRYEITTRSTPYGPISYFTDPHTILRTIYGTWELPDPDFDTVVMAHHLIAFTPLVATYAYQRLLLALLNAQTSKAARYIETIAPHDPDLAMRLRVYSISSKQ